MACAAPSRRWPDADADRWSGPIDVSADGSPLRHAAGAALHYAAGFSGNGVGPSWLGGQTLASLTLGARDEWTALPLVDRPVRGSRPSRSIRRWRLVRWSTLASEAAEAAGPRPPLAARAAAAIPRLLGIPLGTR